MTRIWSFYFGINSEREIAAETFEQALEKGKKLIADLRLHGTQAMVSGLMLHSSADID